MWARVGGAGGGGGRGGCTDSHLSSSDLIVNIIISGRYVNRYLLDWESIRSSPRDGSRGGVGGVGDVGWLVDPQDFYVGSWPFENGALSKIDDVLA